MKHIPRLFVNDHLEFNKTFILDIFDSNHLLHVLKKSHGDEVIIFNDSEEWSGQLLIVKKVCSVKLQKLLRKKDSKNSDVVVYLSLFKRFDLAVEKLIEIGVDKIFPVITDFSSGFIFNKSKINKVVKGAFEQSNRFGDCTILDPISLFDIRLKDDTCYFACIERESCDNLLHVVNEYNFKGKTLAMLVGPEGGFSAREVEFIKSSNFIHVSLGENILRAETAAIVGAFILKNSV